MNARYVGTLMCECGHVLSQEYMENSYWVLTCDNANCEHHARRFDLPAVALVEHTNGRAADN